MRLRLVPPLFLAAILVLLFATPVFAAGGSPGGDGSTGGGSAAGGGGYSGGEVQSMADDIISHSSGSPLSGEGVYGGAVSPGQGGMPGESGFSGNSGGSPFTAGMETAGYPSNEAAPGTTAQSYGDGGLGTSSGEESGPETAGNSPDPVLPGENMGSQGETDSWKGIMQQAGKGSSAGQGGPVSSGTDGNERISREEGEAREQGRVGEAGMPGRGPEGQEGGTMTGATRGPGFTPGWSYSLSGTVTDAGFDSGVASGAVPRGPPDMNGGGQGGMNRPSPPPGHVPYGEVPFGHIPYGPNPAATVMSPAPSTNEEPRRGTRHRFWHQAVIETTEEKPAFPAAFPLVVPPLLPLGYRRIFGKNVLANPSRKRIYDHICQHPGTDLSAVTCACGTNRETTRYHLRQLAAYHKISVLSADGNTRYFQNHGLFSRRDQMVIHHLEKGTSGSILRYIATHRGATRQDIAEYLGIAGPTVSRHLAALAREGLIVTRKEGKFIRCELGPDLRIPGSPPGHEFSETPQGACTGS